MVQTRRLPPLSRIESVALSGDDDPKRTQVTLQYIDRIGVRRELLIPGVQALKLMDELQVLRERLPRSDSKGNAKA